MLFFCGVVFAKNQRSFYGANDVRSKYSIKLIKGIPSLGSKRRNAFYLDAYSLVETLTSRVSKFTNFDRFESL